MKRNFGHEDASAAPPETLGAIVKTFDIEQFLATNERRYIVGSKGSGKTLVLIKKALEHRTRADGLCIPQGSGNPVDRLLAARHVGEKFNQRLRREDISLAWSTVWKHAILCSVLHHLRDEYLNLLRSASDNHDSEWRREVLASRLPEGRAFINSMIDQNAFLPLTPFDYFTALANRLDSARKADIASLTSDVMKLHNFLNLVRSPVYVFLDNLDDYYEAAPYLWTNSMYGQLRAIREIGLRNNNIHVFTSIRQDVFEQFDDEMSLQYFSYVAFLRYDKPELIEVFESNLRELADDLLYRPAARDADPWTAFFGLIGTSGIQAPDSTDESIQDAVVRYTLGRPRDVIHVGNTLLALRPRNEEFDEEIVRRALTKAQQDIAQQYAKEVQAFLDTRFSIQDFVRLLPGNVVSAEDIEPITRELMLISDASDEPCDMSMPFHTLYGLGLLGCLKHEGRNGGHPSQHFQPVGYGLKLHAKRVLPPSDWYLLHPVLHAWMRPGAKSHPLRIGAGLPFDFRSIQ